MAKPLLPDELWALIQPLIRLIPLILRRTSLPGRSQGSYGDHLHPQDRPALGGLASGDGLWLRHDLLEPLRDWQAAGVWDQIHQILLDHLRHADRIDFERFIVDTGHVRAVGGGEETGPSPVDRSKLGSKHAILTDGQGVPLVIDTIPATLRTPIKPCRW